LCQVCVFKVWEAPDGGNQAHCRLGAHTTLIWRDREMLMRQADLKSDTKYDSQQRNSFSTCRATMPLKTEVRRHQLRNIYTLLIHYTPRNTYIQPHHEVALLIN